LQVVFSSSLPPDFKIRKNKKNNKKRGHPSSDALFGSTCGFTFMLKPTSSSKRALANKNKNMPY